MSTAAPRRQLTPLDLVSLVMDAPERPLDFALGMELPHGPSAAALEGGLDSARRAFPLAGARLDGETWCFDPSACSPLLVRSGDPSEEARAWLGAPMDLRHQAPVQQLLVPHGESSTLWTRAHHAALDGTSLALLLTHQLTVAAGGEPTRAMGPMTPPALRTHPQPQRRSAFAFPGPADRLWRRASTGARGRAFAYAKFSAREPREAARRAGGFTYNDLLLTTALETCLAWNRRQGAAADQSLGAWVPMNIRAQPFEGFGNGTSRLRVYARNAPSDPLAVRCRNLREQVQWSKQHGEWAVPESAAVLRLPLWLKRPLLRAYLGRPTVDMGSFSFSHVEHFDPAFLALVSGVRRALAVAPLHPRYALSFTACTLFDTTHLTLTYDAARLHAEDAQVLLAELVARVEAAACELAPRVAG